MSSWITGAFEELDSKLKGVFRRKHKMPMNQEQGNELPEPPAAPYRQQQVKVVPVKPQTAIPTSRDAKAEQARYYKEQYQIKRQQQLADRERQKQEQAQREYEEEQAAYAQIEEEEAAAQEGDTQFYDGQGMNYDETHPAPQPRQQPASPRPQPQPQPQVTINDVIVDMHKRVANLQERFDNLQADMDALIRLLQPRR